MNTNFKLKQNNTEKNATENDVCKVTTINNSQGDREKERKEKKTEKKLLNENQNVRAVNKIQNTKCAPNKA